MSKSRVFFNDNKYILGRTAIEELGKVMKDNGVKKVLCIYGGGSVKTNGVYERVEKMLKENGIERMELWGIQPNPILAKVHEGIAILKDSNNGIDTVLAIGGGSVIDSAKAMCVGANMEGEVYDCFEGKRPFPPQVIPLYAVLTISATASENDLGGVISNPEKKEKLGTGFGNVPVACAVDPTVQYTLPWRQVVAGASDALSHLMETMFSLDGSSITGRHLNFGVQRAIYEAMEIIVKDEKNYEARENLCWAVSLGLRGEAAFLNDEDWNVHHLEHVLSSVDDKVVHGLGLAALAPYYYDIMYKKSTCQASLDLWSKEVMGEADFHAGLEKFRKILLSWKAPAGIASLGFTTEAQADELAAIFEANQKMGYGSGVWTLTEADAKEIYMAAMKE